MCRKSKVLDKLERKKPLALLSKDTIIFLESSSTEKNTLIKNKIFFTDHHHSHASSAFYPSPFNEALVLNMDGVGEWTTTSIYVG